MILQACSIDIARALFLNALRLQKLIMVRPCEAVCNVRPNAPIEWSAKHLLILEPLLNATGRYMEIGLLPWNLAEALGVPCLDGSVALDCLARFHDQVEQPLGACDIERLHLMTLILASDPSISASDLKRLQRMPIIPTEDGKLVATLSESIYVSGNFKSLIPGAKTLSSKFVAIMHPRVFGFLHRLGVQQAEGPLFFQEVLLPCLTGPKKPKLSELVQSTQAACHFLQAGATEDAVASLQHGLWAPCRELPLFAKDNFGCKIVNG